MCRECDYEQLLCNARLDITENRLRVLEVVGNSAYPLPAGDIFKSIDRSAPINRVTVYRILDQLVERGLVERISTGGRAFYYGLAPNARHHPHPHFYCKICGRMDCLNPDSMTLNTDAFWRTFPGRIDKVEIRVDGVCIHCMK